MQRPMQFSTFTIFLMSTLIGCSKKEFPSKIYGEEIMTLGLSSEYFKSQVENDSTLIRDIVEFRKKYNDEKLEIQVINDFLDVEEMENILSCDTIEFSHEFETIYQFYSSIDSVHYKWLHHFLNMNSKHAMIKSLVNNSGEARTIEHAIEQLNFMKEDPEYRNHLYSTSSIYPQKYHQSASSDKIKAYFEKEVIHDRTVVRITFKNIYHNKLYISYDIIDGIVYAADDKILFETDPYVNAQCWSFSIPYKNLEPGEQLTIQKSKESKYIKSATVTFNIIDPTNIKYNYILTNLEKGYIKQEDLVCREMLQHLEGVKIDHEFE